MLKKILVTILVCVLIISMFSCGFDAERELKVEVNKNVSTYILLNYDNVKGVYADVTTIKANGTIYTVYGNVTVNDVYNEKYYASFSGTYELKGKEFHKISLDIGHPQK